MADKILLVDDEPNILSALKRQLHGTFAVHTAVSGAQGLKMIEEEGPFCVVVSDMRMPEMDGIDFLSKVQEKDVNTIRIMLTGNADQETAVKAVNKGNVFRFLTKPCSKEDLSASINLALEHRRLVMAEKELLEQTLAGSVKMLVDIVSCLDPERFQDTARIRGWLKVIGDQLNMEDRWAFGMAVMLATVGEITLDEELAAKVRLGSELTPEEQETVDNAPEVAKRLIGNIPRLEPVANIVYYQKKGYDGSGVPAGEVSGDDIPQGSRILHILNDFAYHEGKLKNFGDAFREMHKNSALYDPDLLKTIEKLLLDHGSGKQNDKVQHLSLGIYSLRPGDILEEDIKLADGKLLLAAGSSLTEVLVEKLINVKKMGGKMEPVAVKRLQG